MKKILAIAILLLSITSCEDFKKGYEEGKKAAEENAVIKVDTLPEITLHKLDGGSIMANNLNLFAQGDTYKGESKQLADAFFIIKHPKGNLLWDTGLPEMLVGKDPYTPEGGAFTISRKDSIKTQLAQIGMTTSDIDMIAFSHIHFDHTGAANNFPDAKWLVQFEEYSFANGEEIKGNTFYDPSSFSKLTNVEKLTGDKDVFGDGTVVIKSMPGHTPGHQVLFLKLKNNGPTLLSGDIYHFEKNRENQIVPQFNYDIPETEKSIKDFEAFAKANNAKVIIQHDAEDFANTPSKLN
ncbi:N-acyl homoserine lactonase family protein [Dokdonia sp. Hel_I_53]|uniref:N-acyl homoserine lactonase family protein n=1 Tax=Dokdonia sp. Hel_I_53 TaxID=1566287 RepID=UPI001199FFA8|nr:N-acyl homoserine lactonase family protein [Dokdonia sp. Hel_I_53]TVZ52332.1 glyoxylase-like metal-dependent hydrolase (beta-lactamase superfamily II) [Dokdonia sp. Hel_I_53]